MTTDRDTTRIVRSWMRVEHYESADRVLDAVLNRLDTTPQRRATRWSARRPATMNTTVKFGLAAAVVAVAALVGINFVADPDVGGPGPAEPTAAATPEPTRTPEPPVAETSISLEGPLPVGRLLLNDGEGGTPRVTVTIPAPGWYGLPHEGILAKNDNPDAPDGAGMNVFLGALGALNVYGDPCRWSDATRETATTVDELRAALAAQAFRDASEPQDITLDGYAGTSITLHVPDDAVFSECDRGIFASWAGGTFADSGGPSRVHQAPGQVDEVWIVDVNGDLVIIDWFYYEGTPSEDVEQLRAIVESVTFDE